ncbi:MAG TPA: DinB family protein [Cyclobacteriaceae bacterium]|nr:DinB family protein [Cyclobacteriaceae bacterium]
MKTTMIYKTMMLALFLGLSGMYGAQAQTTMDEFLAKWDNGKEFTLEVLEKMPDNLLDYRPHESAMSFKEQVAHVAGSVGGLSQGFMLGAEPAFKMDAKPETREELKQFIIDCYDYGKGTISKLTEAQLAEEIDTFAGKVTRRQMLGLIDDHATHHRGAAVSYIRSNGIDPPAFRGM